MEDLICYRFDENGYYIGDALYQIDPLETEMQGKEVYIMPVDSTLEKPLEEKDGYVNRFIENKWVYEKIKAEELSISDEKVVNSEKLIEDKKNELKGLLSSVFPNYNSKKELSVNVDYLASEYHWIVWQCSNTQKGKLVINGQILAQGLGVSNEYADCNSILLPIPVGTTYSSTGHTSFYRYDCLGI